MKSNITIFDIINENSNYNVLDVLNNGASHGCTIETTVAKYFVQSAICTSGKQIDAVAKQCKESAKELRETYKNYRNSLIDLASAIAEYYNATAKDYNKVIVKENMYSNFAVKDAENNLLSCIRLTLFYVGIVDKARSAVMFNAEADKSKRWNNSTACAKLAMLFSMFVEYKTDSISKKRVAVSVVGKNKDGVDNITTSVVNAFETALCKLYSENVGNIDNRTIVREYNANAKVRVDIAKAEAEKRAKQFALVAEAERKAKEKKIAEAVKAEATEKTEVKTLVDAVLENTEAEKTTKKATAKKTTKA